MKKYINNFYIWMIIIPMIIFSCADDKENVVPLYKLGVSSPEVVTIAVGGITTIKLVFSPIHTTEKDIEWISNNENIAIVEEGIVKGIGEGNVIIEAIAKSAPTKKITVRVIVTPVPIEKVTLNIDEPVTLAVDEILKLTAKVIPENASQDLKWSSSNELVATVTEDGEVKALKGGKTIITAMSTSDESKSAALDITVIDPSEIALVQPVDGAAVDGNNVVYPVKFDWIKTENVINYTLKISKNREDFTEAITFEVGDKNQLEFDEKSFDKLLEDFNINQGATQQLYWSVFPTNETESAKTYIYSLKAKRAAVYPQLDNSKFAALPSSSQFQYSQWGSSKVEVLWNKDIDDTGTGNLFYISNKFVTYFALDLGVKAKLSSMKYWGRSDNYFVLRHAKKIQIYGTNDFDIANNPESSDSEWILLNETPFESTRPSGATAKPEAGDDDWKYAYNGEKFVFSSEVKPARYIRFKCLETWGGLEGFWSTEIAFWGEVIE